MTDEVIILKEVRILIEKGYMMYVCNAIERATGELFGAGLEIEYKLKADVRELIDCSYKVESWLGLTWDSPICLMYRLAIIDVLIARYSKE